MLLERPVKFAHAVLASVIGRGDAVVDATAGRGHDTVYLCQVVTPDGKVFSVDIQSEAIDSTRVAVDGLDEAHDVTFVCECHSKLIDIVPAEYHGRIKAVCYNLGYLPGSDKLLITESSTTLQSLDAATAMLARGGIISIVIYSGHEGGEEEMDAVLSWARELDQKAYTVYLYKITNQINRPPMLVVVHKRSE